MIQSSDQLSSSTDNSPPRRSFRELFQRKRSTYVMIRLSCRYDEYRINRILSLLSLIGIEAFGAALDVDTGISHVFF